MTLSKITLQLFLLTLLSACNLSHERKDLNELNLKGDVESVTEKTFYKFSYKEAEGGNKIIIEDGDYKSDDIKQQKTWVFNGDGNIKEESTKKYKDEKFLLPASDQLNADAPITLNNLKVDWTQAVFYKTVISDLSDLADVYYDVLAFFSPTGIRSLFMNFPDFKQNETRIAVFGSTTQKEALDSGLRIDILAPTPETPSMTMALEKYIVEANKGK